MKRSQFLNLILAIALVVVVVRSAMTEGDEAGAKSETMDAIEAIMTRSSVRSYTTERVDAQSVETMLRAAMAAPTAGNRQPWRFVVVDDEAILKQFPALVSGARMAEKAPLAIVACGVPSESMSGLLSQYWVQDCSAATENILLAAHAMGLGAVWCGVYPDSNGRVGGVQKLLNLPEEVIPLSIIVIGHPDSEPNVKDKWKSENVSYNRYSAE